MGLGMVADNGPPVKNLTGGFTKKLIIIIMYVMKTGAYISKDVSKHHQNCEISS